MATTSQRLVTVTSSDPSVSSLLAKLGTFDTKTGGGAGSVISSHTPGGSRTPELEGGRQTFEDVTINRSWKPTRDRPLVGPLLAARSGTRFNVSDQSTDANLNPVGDPVVWSGILSEVNYPDFDSEGDETARLTLVFEIDGIKA